MMRQDAIPLCRMYRCMHVFAYQKSDLSLIFQLRTLKRNDSNIDRIFRYVNTRIQHASWDNTRKISLFSFFLDVISIFF